MIKNVKLIKYDEIKPGAMQDGLPLSPRPEMFVFEVETDDYPDPLFVQTDPTNRHYVEVAEWYKAQKKKPFKYDF